MEYINNRLCVSFQDLVGNGIVTIPSYKKYVRVGKLTVAHRGCNSRPALIYYDNMAESVRRLVDEKLKEQIDMMKKSKQTVLVSLRPDAKAEEFYRTYKSESGATISIEKQQELLLNAEVMNEMRRIEIARNEEHHKGGFRRTKETWSSVLINCNRLRDTYHHTLPINEARLRQKFNEYKRLGYVALVNKNLGNQAARKVGEKEGALLLKLRRSKFPVYTEMQIFEEYNRQAPMRGLRTIESPLSVHNYLYQPDVLLFWYSNVFGEEKFKNKYMPQFDTELPGIPNTLWYSDGTKLNLYYKEYRKGQGWVVCSTDAYEIMDAATEMMVGCYIGDGENFLSQYNAYKDAISTHHVKPYEVVTDNQGGHKKLDAMGFWDKVCHLHKTTMPHNGQSKTIEAAFGRFQSMFLHQQWYFTGQNITTKKASSHPNIDLIMSNKDQLPTLDEMKSEYMRIREEWNNSKAPNSVGDMTRAEMYEAIHNPKATYLDDYESKEIFMLLSPKSIEYKAEGFTFIINHEEYHYMVYGADGTVNMTWHLQNVGNSFRYRYDPDNMTAIELWRVTKTGLKYSGIATPKVKIHRATMDRTEAENHYLFAQLDANKRAKAALYLAQEDMMKEDCLTEAYCMLRMPRPTGISQKDLDGYRKEMELGTLKSPVQAPGIDIPEMGITDEEFNEFATVGDYTKKASNLTDIDLYEKFYGNL